MTEQQVSRTTRPPARRGLGARFASTRARLALAAGVLVVAAAIAVPLAVTGGSSSTPAIASPIAPIALDASGLQTLAKNVPQPIYWAGPKSGKLYELRRTTNGNVYIRYLPPGVKAGTAAAKYLTVATYHFVNAFNALEAVAKGTGISIPGGGIAVVDAKDPKSIHLAYPRVSYQVEIYDPSPVTARSIAVSGAVRPVGG